MGYASGRVSNRAPHTHTQPHTSHPAPPPATVCPTCDSNLGTNPRDLVRTDRTLQSIVDKVFPQFAQKEETKAKPAAPPPRFDDGAPPPAAKKARPGPQAAAPVEEDAPEEISFSLQQASDPLTAAAAAKLEKPYLRTSSRLTVKHLKKYLLKKMKMEPGASYEIEFLCRGNLLDDEHSLDVIWRAHWRDQADDLVLEFRLLPPEGSTEAAAAAELTARAAGASTPLDAADDAADAEGGGGEAGDGDDAVEGGEDAEMEEAS